MMTNDEMLALLREENPGDVIHEVLEILDTNNGYYEVYVDMVMADIFTDIVNDHTKITLVYPLRKYVEYKLRCDKYKKF